MDADDLQRVQRNHDAALRVIREFQYEGKPYGLYLRKFDVIAMRGRDANTLMFNEHAVQKALPDGVNIIAILSGNDDIPLNMCSAVTRAFPLLRVGDDEWQHVVDFLIADADFIFADCSLVGPGIEWELETCYTRNKVSQTVVIVPTLASVFPNVDHHPLIREFPRCIWDAALHNIGLLDLFVTRDLAERAAHIAALPVAERMAIKNVDARLARFPISYAGVATGFIAFAEKAESMTEPGKELELWHYQIYAYFRAQCVLATRLEAGTLVHADYATLIHCYLKLGYLMLAKGRSDGKTIAIGDVDFAGGCASSAMALAARYCQHFVSATQSLLQQVQASEKLIASGEMTSERKIPPFRTRKFTMSRH